MNNHNIDVVSWNVRGLNSGARCLAVHEMLADTICQIACLQETKLQSIDSALASFLGAYRLNKFAYKQAVGTK
jgi:exonuclease III